MIWTTLNGHEARNRGYCQEIEPTSRQSTCNVRWSGYGSLLNGIMCFTLISDSDCASLPEVGAQCGRAARWDLCGGRPVRAVPTATCAGANR